MMQEVAKVFAQVQALDLSKKLKPCKHISGFIKDFTGVLSPVEPRFFQIQGILLMRMIKRFILADDTGLGKTLQMMYAYAYMLEQDPTLKIMWVGPKSTLPEKIDEFKTMLTGVKVFSMFEQGSSDRKRGYSLIEKGRYNGFVTSYGLVRRDYQDMLRALGQNYVVVWDEAAAFKGMDSQTHLVAEFISNRAERVISASATIIKNCLEEAYAIWRVTNKLVLPDYRSYKEQFYEYKKEWIPIKGKGPKLMNVQTGYKNLSVFRSLIRGHYIGRTAEQVGEQLPQITFKEMTLKMPAEQRLQYKRCIAGTLKKFIDKGKEPDKRQVIQEALRISLSLGTQLEYRDSKTLFSKEEALVEMLENDFSNEKVIVYSTSVVWINRMIKILKERKIAVTRITGDEGDDERQKAKDDFNKNPDLKVIFISDAGGEGINLTAARIFIFAMLPWSYGNMKQLLGRYRRIGSKHSGLLALFMMNEGTVDYKVWETLKKKKDLFSKVFDDSIETLDSDKRDLDDIWTGLIKEL